MPARRSILYYYLGSLLAAIALLFFFFFLLFIVFHLGDAGAGRLLANPVSWVAILSWIIVMPIAAVVYFRRTNQQQLHDYINRSVIRYVVAFLMFFYGYTKIYQKFFDITYLTQDSRVADLESFRIAWLFFGRSNVQEVLIGIMEFVPAVLLLFRRTTFPAIAIMIPIALNVTMVNIFNHISGLTLPLSVFITFSLAYLFYGYKEQVVRFLFAISDNNSLSLSKKWKYLRLALKTMVVGVIVFVAIGSLINKLSTRANHNYAGRNKITGGYELEELRVNGVVTHPDTGDTRYYKAIYMEPQNRWNTVLTFATSYSPRMITVKWNTKNDSVGTALKLDNDVSLEATDSTTNFRGTYKLQGDKLLISGTQYGKTIDAVYRKKKLKDYTWFW